MIPIKFKRPQFNWLKSLAGLQIKMLLLFISAGIIPLALTGVIAYFTTVNSMEEEALKAGPGVLNAVAGNLDQLTLNIEMVSSQIALDPEVYKNLAALRHPRQEPDDGESLHANLQRRFQPWITSNDSIQRIFILAIPPKPIQNSPENSGQPDHPEESSIGAVFKGNSPVIDVPMINGDTSWFWEAVRENGRPLWLTSPPQFGNRQDFGIICIRFIRGGDSGLISLLVIELKPQVIREMVSRTIFADGGKVYLLDPGQSIFIPIPPAPGKKVQPDPRLPILRELISGDEFQKHIKNDNPFTMKRTGASRVNAFYHPLRLQGWFLLGLISEAEWTGPFLTTKLGYSFIIILFSGLVIGGSLLFARYWAKPLPKIKDVFRQIASGAPAGVLEVRREDEIGLLAKGYSRVLEKFKRTKAEADLITRELYSITGQIVEKAREIGESSVSIYSTLDELTEATANEAAEVIRCVSNINLLTESVRTVNNYAALIKEMKTDILQLTNQGKSALENLEFRSQDTKTITIEINRLIYNLNEQTQEIQDIVTRIREIVVQTDMISLNATIEATRIKDIKKEVLALAHDVKKHVDHSASAVRKITEVILRIENKTNQATAMAEVANEAVETQSRIIPQCAQVFMALTGAIAGATEQIATVTETLGASFQVKQSTLDHLNEDAGALENCMDGLRKRVREYDP